MLLVGDVDVMPVRGTWCPGSQATHTAAFDYAFYPSDLYYADLQKADGSFEDWNSNKDGFHAHYFGEVRGEKNKNDPINFDHINYRPKIAVGRWPVSNADEVKLRRGQVNRLRRRGCGGKGTYAGADKVAIFHPGGWVDARSRLTRLAEGLPPSWQSVRYLFLDAKNTPGPTTPTERKISSKR